MRRNDKSLPSSTCVNEKEKVSKNGSTLRQKLTKVEHGMIAQLAYEIFEKRGEQHGRDCDDWLEAERQLLQLVQKT
jgi:hypothetical protein